MKKIVTVVIIFAFVFSTSAWAGSYTIPHTFVGGEKALASEVNSNFTAAKTAIDGNAADIAVNGSTISDNAVNITTNAGNVSNNAADITTNAGNISNNAADITTNAGNIADNAGSIAAIWPLLPVACGIINTDGSIRTATPNVVSSTYNATLKWYEIDFDFPFNIFNYLVFVQPLGASNHLSATTDSSSHLLVSLKDGSGTPQQFFFAFIVYPLQ